MSSGTGGPCPSHEASQCTDYCVSLLDLQYGECGAHKRTRKHQCLSKMKANVTGLHCDFPSFDAILFPTEKGSAVTSTKVHSAACWTQRVVRSLL